MVAKKVNPVVVSIHSEKSVEFSPHQFFGPYGDLFGQRPDPKTQKRKQRGLGSGIIISSQGHILTNNHVVGDADELRITLSDNREYEAEIVGTDKLSDVAVIKIKERVKNLPIANLGNSDELEIGETVIAIGSPFGQFNTITKGILSAKQREVGMSRGNYEDFLQTDASINPGNSGGALVNLKGEVIGVNTAIASRSGGSQGIGFAIPINMARDILEDLIYDGKVTRGFLGVGIDDLNQNLSDAVGLKTPHGSIITMVMPGKAAEKAGFKAGDVIVKVDGIKIKNSNHLRNLIAKLDPEKKYTIGIIRNKKKKKMSVILGYKDGKEIASLQESDQSATPTKLGLKLKKITPPLSKKYQLEIDEGLLVVGVKDNTAAEKSGFKEGDVILEIDNKKVNSFKDYKKALKGASKSVLVLISRRGNKKFKGLRLE